ncbi:hypothetical protein AMATHDRAFT_71080 [Amanita thiersii Skay4041]|uniref:G-protein coupled receptors family 1 profile domain-containing protein n=1 Tax=Amanita thiersii Skay4041 TaxID=703135 RepID=A0A2A9NC07_9AGAR|nr:hypothetical protein AMATHDRAFT_71080 [Amanita thiersii Skay4041]
MSVTQPYYGPDEPPETIMLERTFVVGGYIAGAGYGIQIVLYVICAMYLWSQRVRRGKAMLFLLGYITLLLCFETLFIAVSARTVQDAYVDYRNYPGGPWAWFLATQYLPEDVLFYASLFVLTFLSDLLVLWRCWVIWLPAGRIKASLVLVLPLFMLFGSFALGVLWTVESSKPGLSLYSSLPLVLGTSYYVVSLTINILVTIMITIRLILYRRKILDALPSEHAKHYVSLATIIIESAALYTVFAIIFIATYAANHPVNQIFLSVASTSQEVAGYLIILRVAKGQAWDSNTLNNTTTLPAIEYAVHERRKRSKDPIGLSTRSMFLDTELALSSGPTRGSESLTLPVKPSEGSPASEQRDVV